jgi:hypothetical protein
MCSQGWPGQTVRPYPKNNYEAKKKVLGCGSSGRIPDEQV